MIASLLLVIVQLSQAQAQDQRSSNSIDTQDGKTITATAIFKSPDGYMRAEFATFNGVLFIKPKNAAGMYVVYPNKGETVASLRQRALEATAKMFFHDKVFAVTEWQIKPLPPHPGDTNGELATRSDGDMEVQMGSYERIEAANPLVYAYFAMRHKKGKSDDGKFLDENGKGIKDLDKLWQSFGGKK
jgi:hypothetical protein